MKTFFNSLIDLLVSADRKSSISHTQNFEVLTLWWENLSKTGAILFERWEGSCFESREGVKDRQTGVSSKRNFKARPHAASAKLFTSRNTAESGRVNYGPRSMRPSRVRARGPRRRHKSQ